MREELGYISRFSRGLSVMPGIRPRLAIGFFSTFLRSAVKSLGAADVM